MLLINWLLTVPFSKCFQFFSIIYFNELTVSISSFVSVWFVQYCNIQQLNNYRILGSHRGDYIYQLGRRNLIASGSSLKVHRQSIPTNCPHSVLSSSPFMRWVFFRLSSFFVFISNRLMSY